MIGRLPPALILILGATLVPLLRGRVQKAYLLLLPVASFVHLLGLPDGASGHVALFDVVLTLTRVDSLSFVFGVVFHIATFLAFIYSLHDKDNTQHVAALVYAGSAIGAAFAGDLLTLFIHWEVMAVSSTFLIWCRRTPRANAAGMRYLAVQAGSGVLLLIGVVLRLQGGGSIEFNQLGLDSPGGWLIFLAFGIKCAFPLLHNWLQDAYPEATISGTVFLSAFTTKLAVYALARGFPGTPILIGIGTVMTMFPIFYAVIENDLRRVLAYSMNNQLGFMVVGVGIGTHMALNGAVAHAFADILFKGLLFMSMGAVLLRAGTIKGSELGGLYKSMPITAAFCIVGAASISAFPLFSAFVTKSLVITAAADQSLRVVWFFLVFASAGVFHHAGIKIPYFAFFAHDSGKRCKEAPLNMLVAMGLAAALCIGIGVRPSVLYRLLPYQDVQYQPYTATHAVAQLQLLLFSALAFSLLIRTGLYPPETRSTNLDSDWTYRRLGPLLWRSVIAPAIEAWGRAQAALAALASRLFAGDIGPDGTGGRVPRPLPISVAVLMTVLALLLYLLLGAR